MSQAEGQAAQIQKPLIARALVIGLGTTGLRVVNDIRRQISLRWGDPDELPSVDYLVLETNNQELEKKQSKAGETRSEIDLPGEKRISLAIPSTHVYRTTIQTEPYLKWLAPEAIQGDFTLGAGGVRMKGRLALFHHYQQVKEAIRKAIRGVAYCPEGDRFQLRQKVWVYLVGTLGGGTASGTFIDLAYICRQTLEEEQVKSRTLIGMYTLPPATETSHNQAVNAYAALQELNHWNYGGSVFQAQYTQQPRHRLQRHEQPFDYCFLIGPTNSCAVLLSEVQQNRKIADFIFLATATDALDKVHGDLVDQEIALTEPDLTGSPSHYLTFGVNTIEFPLQAVETVLATHMAKSILERWTQEVDYTRIGLPEAARDIFGRVGLGTEGVSEEMQVISRVMRQDTQDDVMNHWRTRGRPRIEARVAEYLSSGQFDAIPSYLETEFNRNIEPLNKGYDSSIDPLDQDEVQLGDMLRAMQAASRALVGTAAARVVEEVALRWTGPEGTRTGGLIIGQAIIEECAKFAARLADQAQNAAESYRGANEGFNGDRREQQSRIDNLANSFVAKLMGNPRSQIEISFKQWMDATENYLSYSVAFYAYSYAAALYRRLAQQLSLENDRARWLIGELRRDAEGLGRKIQSLAIDRDSLWQLSELQTSYERYRDPTAEEEVTSAALQSLFAGTQYERTPYSLLLMYVDFHDLDRMMVDEATRKFGSLKGENVLERWWQMHQERGDTEAALEAFLKGSAPYLDFPQQTINDFEWRAQLSRRTFSMHGHDGRGTRAERDFRRALMNVQPPGYYGGAPRENEFQPVIEPYLVTAAVTVAGFPLRLVPMVEQLGKHFAQGKTRTQGVEGAAPVYSRRDVAFRPIEVPSLHDQRRAWRLLAIGQMLDFVKREADPNGVRFKYAYRDRNGNNQTLLSEYLPAFNRPADAQAQLEIRAEQIGRKDELMRMFRDTGLINLPPMLRGLIVSLCSNRDGLNALERVINERVNRDRLAARKEFVDRRNQAEAQGVEWWPYLDQVFAEWERDVLRLPPADNVGRIEQEDSPEQELEVGTAIEFRLRAFTADGSDTPLGAWDAALLTWHSSNPDVVAAEVRGCRGVKEGTATVTGEFPNVRGVMTVEYRVTVHPAVTDVRIDGSPSVDLQLGAVERAPIRLLARDASQPPVDSHIAPSRLTWRATHPTIATVEDGHVVARGVGKDAEILGHYQRVNGETLQVRYLVNVWPQVDQLVSLPDRNLMVAPGEVVTLQAGGRFQGQAVEINEAEVRWSMPATTVGELQGNRFLAYQPGQVVIKGELPQGDGLPLLTTYAITVGGPGQPGAGAEGAPPVVAEPPLPQSPPPPPAPGSENLDRPAPGMSRKEVVALLGKPVSQQKLVKPETDELQELYFYDLEDGTVLQVTLVDGKVNEVRER